jgi:hypothetical protein
MYSIFRPRCRLHQDVAATSVLCVPPIMQHDVDIITVNTKNLYTMQFKVLPRVSESCWTLSVMLPPSWLFSITLVLRDCVHACKHNH